MNTPLPSVESAQTRPFITTRQVPELGKESLWQRMRLHPNQDALTGDILIQAPCEQVYKALTDPAQLLQWWGQNGIYRCAVWEIDLRPGGKWVTRGVGADGKPFRVAGEYLEVDPPRALEYTCTVSWSGDLKTTARWELEAGGD